jgi:hypothetical protein
MKKEVSLPHPVQSIFLETAITLYTMDTYIMNAIIPNENIFMKVMSSLAL